ncbi:GxxExxY protein [Candidatus Uhrbacteria bacterium]|nr:GxxExxY protein [Candidatus Uhrbacteria bacterium]
MEEKVVHKELSYKIVGIAFDVYNELGSGYQEKYYQRGFAEGLKKSSLKFNREVFIPIRFKEESIGRYYLDFLVDSKVIVELKKGDYFGKKNIEQVNAYLKATNLQLAILINFTSNGVKFMRLLNVKQ